MDNKAQHILETAPIPLLVVGSAGKILLANAAACDLFGCDRRDLIEAPLSDFLPISDANELLKQENASESRQLSGMLEVSEGQNGQRFFEAKATMWLTEENQRHYTIAIHDVTGLHNVETELRRTLEHWDYALTGAGIGLFEVDLSTGESVVSTTWRTLMGVSNEVDAQANWLARVHPDDLPLVQAADRDCIKGLAQRSLTDYRMRTSDGSAWCWMRSEAVVAARDASGTALRLIGTQTDITAIRNADEALRLTSEQFRSAFDNAPIGKALVDLEGRWLRVNQALCNLLGYSESELLNTHFQNVTHPEDLDSSFELVQQLQTGVESSLELEKRYIRSDGTVLWGLLNATLVCNSDGKPDHVIAQIMDISEQRRLERMKSEFVATVSHELRTPLTSILGAVGLLASLSNEEFSDDTNRLLYIAQQNCERLKHLVNDILDFEKLSLGQARFTISKERVATLLDRAVLANSVYAENFGARLVLQKVDRNLMCSVDPDRFQQVAANLLSNAAKFSDYGAPITIGVKSVDGFVRVSITNSGSSIPTEFRDSLFKPFSQIALSSTRKRSGTGLGLSISKRIVEQMGGKIGFSCKKGETTFWFTLPV